MKPRVLFFCPVPDFKGGAESVLRDMLRNPAITPLLAVPEEGPVAASGRVAGIATVTIPFGAIGSIRRPLRAGLVLKALRDLVRAARELKVAARALNADLIHSNGLQTHVVAALTRIGGGPRVVIHIHDLPVYRVEGLVWRALAAIATRTIVVSRACWPSSRLPSSVQVVHNGVELDEAAAPPAGARRPLVVGFCGRLHPFKGLHLLPDWLAAAREAGLDTLLVIRGKAAPEHEPYVADVRRRFAALGLAGQVRFEGRKQGLAAIYGGLHAVVVPSATPEPFGLAVAEAMGLGLPVIAYPAGGILELVRPGETGWFAADAEQFVAALKAVATGGPVLAGVTAAAREMVLRDLAMPAMYGRLDTLYGEVVGSPVAGGSSHPVA